MENDYLSAIERYEETSARWKEYWWEGLQIIYQNCKEFAKNYVLNPIARTVQRLTSAIKRLSKYSNKIIVDNGIDLLDSANEKCYLFEFYNSDNEHLCSKVGTTTRTVRERLKEELKSKTYKEMGCDYAIVKRVYNCNEIPAEGLESFLRAEYIKQYPNSFKKNDRFIKVKFDFDLCDDLASEYLAMA